MTDAGHYRDLLRPVLEDRKVVVAVEVVQAAGNLLPLLADLGAKRPFVLAGAIGTGPVPTDEDADIHVVGLPGGPSIMDNIRQFEAVLLDLPPRTLAALDAYDPDREAIVLGTLFTHGGELAGRPVYGGRPAEWERMEDKTFVDPIFDAAGLARAPSAVVAVAHAHDTATRLDRGYGTAWAGDAREGWWGGAAYLRWVRTDEHARDAEAFFAAHCDTVRVMPFLEGIPCSIHGVVFPETVIAFRPVEMLTLRRAGANELMYSGLDTFWDPPDEDRASMRAAARVIGSSLRDCFDYRGAFTLDGVLTEEGFLPTELNPRPGAGLGPQAAAAGVSLFLLNKMLIERAEADYRPSELEELIVTAADAKRGGACYTIFPGERTTTDVHGLAKHDGRYTILPEGESGDGVLIFGPSHAGSFVRFEPDATRLPRGPSFGPAAVEVFAFTDAEFGTGFGPLEAATSVRG